MTSIIVETFIKLLSSAGIFLGFVVVLYLLQRLACGLAMKQFGGKVIYFTAPVGVSCHEISHYFACFPFGHRVTEISFFKFDGTGTLGYVNHSYNPSNLWHVIGNFFIGIAPLFGGTLAIYCLTSLLLPNHQQIQSSIISSTENFDGVQGVTSFLIALFSGIKDLFIILISSAKEAPYPFAIWLYLTASLSLYLSPSPADMRGATKGFVLIILMLTALCFVSYSMGESLFKHISETLLSLSVSYSICILLAAAMGFVIFLMSLLTNDQ